MRGIALDASTSKTGWFAWIDAAPYEHGLLLRPKGANSGAPFVAMGHLVMSMLDTFKPDWLIIEDIYMRRNVKAFETLARFHGVLEAYFIDQHIPYMYMQANVADRVLGLPRAKRERRKDLTALYAARHGFDGLSEDEADAYLLGSAALHMYSEERLAHRVSG